MTRRSQRKSSKKKYDPGIWENAPVSEVEKLRLGIDGLVRYTIVKAKTSKATSAALLTDGRRWKKSNVTQ